MSHQSFDLEKNAINTKASDSNLTPSMPHQLCACAALNYLHTFKA